MRLVLLFAVLIIFIPTVHALEWAADFHIIGNSIAVEYEIDGVSQPFALTLPSDSSAVELNGRPANISFLVDQDSRLTYIFGSALQRTDKGYFLFDFVAPIDIARLKIAIWLPEGAWLEAGYPKGYNTTTDGKVIVISWDGSLSKNQSMPIFVIFREKVLDWTYLVAGIAAIGLAGFLIWQRRKKSPAKTLYLLEDERKIVELLTASPNRTMKQKEIWRATGWSKAKLSRTVRRLQERGVVDVRPYGNTNLVILKKVA